MERRIFLQGLGATACLTPFANAYSFSSSALSSSEALLERFVKHNDDVVKNLLVRQEKDTQHPWYGGLINRYGIHTPQGSLGLLQRASCAYVSEDSRYYQDASLHQPMLMASQYLLKAQHPDGTIDLHTTNFHSTPDLAFTVEPATLAYTLLNEHADESTLEVRENLKTYLQNGALALADGGIHTPNHRWVVCMAAARVHHLFPNPALESRVDEWLQEKIDIDEDGQYTEQSTLIYSPTVDKALITVARLMDKPELFVPVRRNLEMTLYYLHANGEGVSEGSGRQDQYQRGTLLRYYYPYRYMALHDQNPRFAAMTRMLEAQEQERLDSNMAFFLEDPALKKTLPQSADLPDNYLRVFRGSDLVRVRRGERDATILAKNPLFFSFFKGNAALEGVRLASAFFGKGQFEGESLEREGDEFVLRQWLEGPYYQPYPVEDLPHDGDWEEMPRENRPQSEVQKLLSEIRISETENGFLLDISITGTDRIPVAVEMAFRKGGKLSNVRKLEDTENAFLLEEGYGTLKEGDQQIRFGPGRAEHSWTQLRGALPKMEAQCVYLTGFTPFEQRIEIA